MPERRASVIAAMAIAAVCCASVPDRAAAAALVRQLYSDQAAGRGPFFRTDTRDPLDHYFERSLADLLRREAVEADGEVGAIDFDPLYGAQDSEAKNLTVHPPAVDGARAIVRVSFDSFGEQREVTYELVAAGNGWKISDIRYADGRSLRDTLTRYSASPRSATATKPTIV